MIWLSQRVFGPLRDGVKAGGMSPIAESDKASRGRTWVTDDAAHNRFRDRKPDPTKVERRNLAADAEEAAMQY